MPTVPPEETAETRMRSSKCWCWCWCWCWFGRVSGGQSKIRTVGREMKKHAPNTERPVHMQVALTQPRSPTARHRVPGGQRGHRGRCSPRHPRPLPGLRCPHRCPWPVPGQLPGACREICHSQFRHGPGQPRALRLYAGQRRGREDRRPAPGCCCQGSHPPQHRTRLRRYLRQAQLLPAHEPAPSAPRAASVVAPSRP